MPAPRQGRWQCHLPPDTPLISTTNPVPQLSRSKAGSYSPALDEKRAAWRTHLERLAATSMAGLGGMVGTGTGAGISMWTHARPRDRAGERGKGGGMGWVWRGTVQICASESRPSTPQHRHHLPSPDHKYLASKPAPPWPSVPVCIMLPLRRLVARPHTPTAPRAATSHHQTTHLSMLSHPSAAPTWAQALPSSSHACLQL